MMRSSYRSLLFVPADNRRLLENVARRGADAVILDLEDAVLPSRKREARQSLADDISRLNDQRCSVMVRINTSWLDILADLAASVSAGVTALVVPKVESASKLEVVAAMVGEWEAERGLQNGSIGLLGLIESPLGLHRAAEIAAAPRLIGLALGGEDFALSLGVEPNEASLDLPCRQLALVAAAHGISAIGLPGSLTEFSDLAAYRETAERGRRFGVGGALCIHPSQVTVINDVFMPTADELEWATNVTFAWVAAEAGGRGATAVDGRMIDRPVVERAKMVLARARRAGQPNAVETRQ